MWMLRHVTLNTKGRFLCAVNDWLTTNVSKTTETLYTTLDFYMVTVIRTAAIRMIIFWNRTFLKVEFIVLGVTEVREVW